MGFKGGDILLEELHVEFNEEEELTVLRYGESWAGFHRSV